MPELSTLRRVTVLHDQDESLILGHYAHRLRIDVVPVSNLGKADGCSKGVVDTHELVDEP